MYLKERIEAFVESKPVTEEWRVNLLKAADLIDKGDLVKGAVKLPLYNARREFSGVAYCVHGAVMEVHHVQQGGWLDCTNTPELAHLRDHLVERGIGGVMPGDHHVCGWNNDPFVTKEQVVSTMRACALA